MNPYFLWYMVYLISPVHCRLELPFVSPTGRFLLVAIWLSHQPRGRTHPRNQASKPSTQQPLNSRFTLEWRRSASPLWFYLPFPFLPQNSKCTSFKLSLEGVLSPMKSCGFYHNTLALSSHGLPHSQSSESSSPTWFLSSHQHPQDSHNPSPGSLGLQKYFASTPSFTHVGSTSGAREPALWLGHSHTPMPSPEISIVNLITPLHCNVLTEVHPN